MEEFIKRFEAAFKGVILPPSEGKDWTCKNSFKIWNSRKIPRPKYSDWDIECFLDADKITNKKVAQIEDFIRSFDKFNDVGLLLTFSDKYLHIPHNPNRSLDMSTLPFMAYMPGESESPFVDIHVNCVKNELIRQVYKNKSDDELLDWLILTAWRKIRNGGNEMEFIRCYICPAFTEDCEKIIANPIPFFKKHFSGKNYADVVQFLTS